MSYAWHLDEMNVLPNPRISFRALEQHLGKPIQTPESEYMKRGNNRCKSEKRSGNDLHAIDDDPISMLLPPISLPYRACDAEI